jgi:hypothetical protein
MTVYTETSLDEPMKYHLRLSLHGAISNWNDSEWLNYVTNKDGCTMTPQEVKSTFIELLDQGTKYIPMDSSCDNFNTEKGCQGHLDLVDYLSAVDCLHNAGCYLSKQFSSAMDKTEAQAHFDSRAYLCRLEQMVLNEAEAKFLT